MAFLMVALSGFWQVAPSLTAATLTWDTVAGNGGAVTGGSGTWTNGLGNWNTGSGDTTWNSATPDAAIFGGTGGTVTLGGAVTVGNMVFNSGYTLADGGNALTLSNSTITANAAATISAALGGSTGLIKDGAATLTLSGASSYTGATVINAGVLNVTTLANGGSNSNIGAATNVASNLVLNGGTLQYNNSVTGNTDRLFSVGTSGGTISMPVVGTLNLTNTGNIGFNGQSGARTVTFAFSDSPSNAGNIVLSGAITDNGGATSLLKANAFGILRLASNNNTYTGTTTINGGSVSIGALGGSTGSIGSGNIILNGGGTLSVSRSGTVNLSQTISGTGGVILNGSAALTLSGTNTYTGFTNVLGNGGVLTVSDIGNGGVPSAIGASSSAASNLLITTLSTLRYVGTGASTDRLFSVSGGATGVGTIDASGTGPLVFTNTGAMGFASSTGTRTLILSGTNTQNNTMTPVIGDNSGATALTKSGTGTWVVAGANSYTGVTTVSGGVLSVSSLANGGSNSNLGASTNAATNVVLNGGTLQYTGAAVSTDRLFSVGTSGGTLDASGGGAVNFTNTGSMAFNNQTGTRTLTLKGTNTGANTLAAVIGDNSGATAVTKSGTGTWVLTGTNTYSGVTTVSGGALQIGNGGTSGTLGSGAVANSGTLVFNRSDVIAVTNSINGSGGINQAGSGTTILTSVNNYLGVTTVSGGILSISVLNGGGTSSNIGAASSAASNIVLNGGTLLYTGGAITSDRLFSVGTNGGTVNSSGTGALNLSNTGSMGFNGQSGARTLTLTGANSNANTLAAVIGDSGGATAVTKANGGNWTLSGANSYTGVTTVNGGVLTVTTLANGGSSSNIGSSSNAAANLVLNGGTLQYNSATTVSTDRLFSVGTSGGTISLPVAATVNFTNTGSIGFNGQTGARTLSFAFSNSTFGGIIVLASGISDNGGATSVVKSNTYGTLRLTSNSNTYTGTTTIIGGAVSIGTVGGSTGSIGSGDIIINSGGTLFVSRSGSVTLAQTISGGGGVTSNGNTALTLSGTNTYTGVTRIISNGGVVTVSDIENGGVASSIGASSSAADNLSITNLGTLKYVGTGATTDRLFEVPTGTANPVATIDASGTGALVFASTGAMGFGNSTGARTLILSGTNTDNNTMTPVIGDNSGATALTKSGAGTWVLAGNNTYTGVTTINAGVLEVGSGGTTGSLGAGSVFDYASLIINRADAVTIANAISGTGTFTQAGTGTTTFSTGTKSYTGATFVNAGKLQAGGANAFSTGSAVTVASGAVLEVNGFNVVVGGLSGAGTVQNGTATGATLNIGGSANASFDGLIQNGGSGFMSINKGGLGGTLTLTGSNTYTGGTVVSAGTLSVSALANGGVASNIGASSNAAFNLLLNGGTLSYTGAAVSTDRLFSVTTSGGTLDASGTGAVNFTNTGAMGFNSQSGSRTLTLTGTNTGNNTIAAAIGDNGGATSLVKSGSGNWVLTGTNTYSGTTTINAGVLQVGNGSTTGRLGSGAVTNNGSLMVKRSDALTISNTISGSGSFTQAGAGTTTLSGSNSYAGVTAITSGVLNVTTLANGGSNSSIGASSNAATNLVLNGGTLQYTGSANMSTDRLFSVGIGGGVIDVSGTGNLNFTNTGSMGFNGESGERTLVLSGTNTTGVNIIAAAIGDFGGATSVSIDGDATWLLTGANTYTGATTLSAGVLQIGGSNLASAIIVGAHATLELNGTDAKIGSLAGSGIVRNNSGTAATLTTGGNDTSTNFSGVIQDGGAGSLSLVKLGTGTLTLSGSNSYTGTTTISSGELQIGSGGTTGTLGTGAVINNAALTVNRSDAISIANNISGSGNFTQAGAGTTTLSGDNSYGGSTTINSGVLSVSVLANGGVNSNLGASSNAAGNLVLNGGTLQYTGAATSTDRLFSVGTSGGTLDASGTGAVNFTNTGSVDFNGQSGLRTLTLTGSNTGGNTLAAVIRDNGGATALTKSGSGTWVITAANTYTGATTISGGTLQIGNGGTTGSLSTSSVINNNGTLAFNRSDLMTQGTDFASVISGSGGVTQAGSGTLTLNGDNTYTGGTSIQSGTLEVTSNNALGTGDAGTTVSSGGTLLLNNVNYGTSEALKLNGSGAGGGGALRNSGTSTYSGVITAETNASINVGGGILNLTGGLVKDGTVLTITGGGTVNVSGAGISGASASSDLVVDGTTVVVSADSDYNGPTIVQNAATLVANAAVATTQMNLSSDSMLAGTGAITTAMNQSIFINGTFSVGDPAVPATATSFALTTSGTGAVVLGAGSVVRLDLFTGAGLGNNLSNAAAADSINLHGRLDGSAGGTVVIGNPNGMTGFHGGDQWQLVKLNTGDANAGSITSQLALNDSSLGLASGVTSYLDSSTGIFSIIDTNGGLALAAVEGQALISAGNLVTADLNGHLFNLRNGEGEEAPDTIAAAMDEGVIVGEGDGGPTKKDSPIAKRVARTRQWESFATVNYGNVRLNPIRTQSGVQVDSWASSVGVERHLTRGLKLGFAASFLQSTQGYTGNLGSLYLEGPALSTYLSYVRGGFWNSLLYSFGTYQMDTTRNPGAPFPTAHGTTRTYTHSVQYNTGWNFRFQNNTLVTGPFVGVDYLHGSVDAYGETGGGLAALHYSAQSYQSLVSRVGWSASKQIKTRFATVTPQLRLSYERQNIRNNNGTSVSLINVPFTAVGGGQTPGQDYLVAGMGVSVAFTERFSLMLSYQGQFFRHDLQAHFGSIRFSYQF